MFFLDDQQPIIALSTGTTNSALAILRLSGFADYLDFASSFSSNYFSLQARRATLVKIFDQGKLLDEAMVTLFPAPNSYTGENVLELAVHGNQLNVQRLIDFFVRQHHCRLAAAGEFTYRALKNNKLSLSQVEGLDQLLNATSTLMLDQGLATLHGELHHEYLKLHEAFLQLKSAVELSIDFLEDIGEEQGQELFNSRLNAFCAIVHSLYARTTGNLNQLLTPSLVLLGKTNAGKSSLFNFLLQSSRAIVSPIHGTTRDFISEYVFFQGTHFRLVDTAGLRASSDAIEGLGIERSHEQIAQAFFKILVIDPFDFSLDQFSDYLNDVDCIAFTHADLEGFSERAKVLLDLLPAHTPIFSLSLVDFEYGPIEPLVAGPIEPLSFGPIEPLSRQHFLSFLQRLVLSKYQSLTQDSPILVQRQRALLAEINAQVVDFKHLSSRCQDMGILSHEVMRLEAVLGELIGIITPDQVLASIFSNFCIGK